MSSSPRAATEARAFLRRAIERDFAGRIAVVTSFGTESAVLLDLVAGIDPATPVLFLDTGRHFPETLGYRDRLVRRLGLSEVRSVRADAGELARRDAEGRLWREDADLCCTIRKVRPLARALAGFDAWLTGRKRYQGGARDRLRRIERIDGRVKLNPLADWSRDDVERAFEARGLPRHPLSAGGYASVGCECCTARIDPGAPPRSGRWPGSAKNECGIHARGLRGR